MPDDREIASPLFPSAEQCSESRPPSPTEQQAPGTAKPRSHFVLGLLLLLVVVLLWVFSSVLTQYLYDDPSVDYDKPTALTTLCTSTASIFLLPQVVQRGGCRRLFCQDTSRSSEPGIGFVILVTLNWFLCQWTFNLSLAHTALSTNTLLSSSSVVWSYVFGFFCGTSRASVLGVSCVVLALSGVSLTVFGGEERDDPHAPVDSIFGVSLALGSAVAYGVFSNALAKRVQPEQMSQVWGCVGILSVGLGGVLMLLGQLTGLEPLEVPSPGALGIMLLNGFLGTSISDYIWARGLLLTSPLVATVSLNLTIPVSFLMDTQVLHQHTFHWTAPLGAILVFLGVAAGAAEDATLSSSSSSRSIAGVAVGCGSAGEARRPTGVVAA